MNHRFTAYLFLLIVSVIWGVAGPVIKFTLGSFPPLVFLVYRLSVSSTIALIVLTANPPRFKFDAKMFFHMILHSTLIVSLGLGLLFFGFDKTTSLSGTVISSMGPMLVAIAGALFLHEHITKQERVGMAIALLGTLFVTIGPLFNGTTAPIISFKGNLLIIASLVADTLGTVIAKVSLRERVPPFVLTGFAFAFGLITLLPFMLSSYSMNDIAVIVSAAPLSAHMGVWYMAILSGTLAYTLQLFAMRHIEIGEVAVFNYLFPIWAAPLSLLWLGEKITTPFVVGAAIIASGVIIAERKRRNRQIH